MLRNLFILAGLALTCTVSHADNLTRLKYNNPGLTVDLAVGLWAWPMPMDYDNDGDFDLVVSCPDVPYNGIYLFENPGPAKTKMPVFKPAKKLGPGKFNITVSHVDGKPRVLVPGAELTAFAKGDVTTSKKIYPKTTMRGGGRIRANQWRYVDYDGDKKLDLIVGHGYWGDYGWDNAYNKKGEWTNGPLHGYIYYLRNKGTNENPTYEEPQQLMIGEDPIDVFGMPSPNFADFDGDGDLDLLCGEFTDGFTWFHNIGTRTKPLYAPGRKLLRNGQPLTMHLCMIVVSAPDWDKDGDIDLIVGQEDGRVALLEHTGKTDAKNGNMPIFAEPRFFQQEADDLQFGVLITPVGFDWDGDGDEDIVAGNSAGEIGFLENLDGGNPPKWAAPKLLKADGKPIRIKAGPNGSIQGPAERQWGYTTIDVGDWDHDGLPDIMANSIWGKVVWYRNIGTRKAPKLAAAQPVQVRWPNAPPGPKWNWWKPKDNELVTQWRTTPLMVDWNKDGLNDLVMLDHQGFLALFRRQKIGDQLLLKPGERIFDGGTFDRSQRRLSNLGKLRLNNGEAGKSGRRQLSMVDFDGDGKRDLLINSRNINFLRNLSSNTSMTKFVDDGPLDTRRLSGHGTHPTTVDWDNNGIPDLLVGAEDGRLYYMANRLQDDPKCTFSFNTLKLHGSGFKLKVLDDKKSAFANRKYVWFGVPEKFRGWKYTQVNGGERPSITVEVKRDTTLYLATAPSQKGINMAAWTELDTQHFHYTDRNETAMFVYKRFLRAGSQIKIPQGNWTGGILLLPPDLKTVTVAKGKSKKRKRPNVLFIAVDDMRTDLGCYGHKIVKSPFIDKLAVRGTLFNRAYCQQAVCNPSRASLLTGMRPSSLGIWDLPTHFRQTHPKVLTLPQLLKQAGYHTVNIGKIFHNWRQDDFKGDALSWSVPAEMHYNTHGADKAVVKGELPPNLIKVPRCEMRDVPDEAYFDGRIANKAVAALQKLKDRDEPFFLAVGFWKPHAHFNAPKRYWDMYDRKKIDPPANPNPPKDVPEIALHDSREIMRGFKNARPGGKLTQEDVITLRHGYYAAISYVDAQVGKVIAELDRLGLAENTIIIFWSDHGYHLGEHGLWAKTSNFELDARVPMIIATPDHKGGQRSDVLVELLDLYPTVTELCSVSKPGHVEGVSLKPVLDNPRFTVKPAAFTWHPRPAYPPNGTLPKVMGYSMRTEKYRYTEWRQFKTGKVVARELYDHTRDPWESVNLVGDPDWVVTVGELSKLMVETHPRKGVKILPKQ